MCTLHWVSLDKPLVKLHMGWRRAKKLSMRSLGSNFTEANWHWSSIGHWLCRSSFSVFVLNVSIATVLKRNSGPNVDLFNNRFMLFDDALVYSRVHWFQFILPCQTTVGGDAIIQVGGGAELHYCANYAAQHATTQAAHSDKFNS